MRIRSKRIGISDPPHSKRYQHRVVCVDENAECLVEVLVGELFSCITQHHCIRLGAVQSTVVLAGRGVDQEEGPQVVLLQVLDAHRCRGEDVVLCHIEAGCTQLLYQVCPSALRLITA